MKENLYKYILAIADNSLILGQRLGELCGHGPNLETDIACTNIALDLLGQARNYFQYAAKLKGGDATEDTIAMLRTEREYLNVLLVEQPNTDFAFVITRQFLFDVFHWHFLKALQKSHDITLAAVANRAIKEVTYHKKFSSDWVKRLGDGTGVSHDKMQSAINDLWRYREEFFIGIEFEKELISEGIAVDTVKFKEDYYKEISEVLSEATLQIPEDKFFQKGGKEGIHSEHMGYILTELQYMQRAFPNMTW